MIEAMRMRWVILIGGLVFRFSLIVLSILRWKEEEKAKSFHAQCDKRIESMKKELREKGKTEKLLKETNDLINQCGDQAVRLPTVKPSVVAEASALVGATVLAISGAKYSREVEKEGYIALKSARLSPNLANFGLAVSGGAALGYSAGSFYCMSQIDKANCDQGQGQLEN